ncbi:hypothetical protein Ac2012v2_000104 [Leucoagaricus gongylophorus]
MATITLSRFSKSPPNGPSKLSKILHHLNQQPRLQLKKVANFKVLWRAQKCSSDIRRFVRDTLPRIRYANPTMPIEADRVWKKETDSNIQLVLESGKTSTIKMDGLSSSAILKQLMLAAGGDNWVEYEENRRAQGLHSALGPDKKLTASIQPVTPTRSASSRKIRASA